MAHLHIYKPEILFYKTCPVDGPTLIIVPSAMILDWKENIEKFTPANEEDNKSLVYIIAPEAYAKRA